MGQEKSKQVSMVDIKDMLANNDSLEKLVKGRSELYTPYSVKDKNGKFRSVVDIDSVVGLLRELAAN